MSYSWTFIGTNLKNILKTANISQTRFARACGITESSLSLILAGYRKGSIDLYLRMMNAFPITVEMLASEMDKNEVTQIAVEFAQAMILKESENVIDAIGASRLNADQSPK